MNWFALGVFVLFVSAICFALWATLSSDNDDDYDFFFLNDSRAPHHAFRCRCYRAGVVVCAR
jgi:hypothetical protein